MRVFATELRVSAVQKVQKSREVREIRPRAEKCQE